MIVFWSDYWMPSHSFKLAMIGSAFWCIYFRRQGPCAQWVVGYHESNVKCALQIFDFYVWVYFDEEMHEEKLYFLLDKWFWKLPKA